MELFDEDLKVVLGDRYNDREAAPVEMPVMEREARPKEERKAEKVPNAEYVEIPTYAPNFFDRLKGCAKYALIFGGLTFLLFYWQEAGLMDPVAAVPSMCVCTCLGGFKIGGICRE